MHNKSTTLHHVQNKGGGKNFQKDLCISPNLKGSSADPCLIFFCPSDSERKLWICMGIYKSNMVLIREKSINYGP